MIAAMATSGVDESVWDEVFEGLDIIVDEFDLQLADLDIEIDPADSGDEPLDFDDLDVETLIRLKHSGVTRDYAASLAAIGYEDLTLRDLASLRAVGADRDGSSR